MVSVLECGVSSRNVVNLCVAEPLKLFCCGPRALTRITVDHDVLGFIRKFRGPLVQLSGRNVDGSFIGTQRLNLNIGTHIQQSGSLFQKLFGFFGRNQQRRTLGLPNRHRNHHRNSTQSIFEPTLHYPNSRKWIQNTPRIGVWGQAIHNDNRNIYRSRSDSWRGAVSRDRVGGCWTRPISSQGHHSGVQEPQDDDRPVG